MPVIQESCVHSHVILGKHPIYILNSKFSFLPYKLIATDIDVFCTLILVSGNKKIGTFGFGVNLYSNPANGFRFCILFFR